MSQKYRMMNKKWLSPMLSHMQIRPEPLPKCKSSQHPSPPTNNRPNTGVKLNALWALDIWQGIYGSWYMARTVHIRTWRGKSQVLESLHPADKKFNWRIRIDKGECSQSCLDLKCPKAYFETLEHWNAFHLSKWHPIGKQLNWNIVEKLGEKYF